MEEIIKYGKFANLVGILTQATSMRQESPCVIFLNAGLIHKVGPNRLYVNLARHFTKQGINTFRFDFSGMGDSGISKIKDNNIQISEIKQSMDIISKRTGTNKFILMGICSGAELAFEASLVDDRIVGLSLIDGIFLDKDTSYDIINIAQKNATLRYYKKKAFNLKSWKKLISGKSKLVGIIRNKLMLLQNKYNWNFISGTNPYKKLHLNSTTNNYNILNWEKILKQNVSVNLIFCEGGVAIDVYKLTIANILLHHTNLDVKYIKDVDHTFTPLWAQRLLTDLISKWLYDSFKY